MTCSGSCTSALAARQRETSFCRARLRATCVQHQHLHIFPLPGSRVPNTPQQAHPPRVCISPIHHNDQAQPSGVDCRHVEHRRVRLTARQETASDFFFLHAFLLPPTSCPVSRAYGSPRPTRYCYAWGRSGRRLGPAASESERRQQHALFATTAKVSSPCRVMLPVGVHGPVPS